ncbi:MAG: hypothetical protein IH627_17920 [Rubrivivax sp.]|nr:hypothetical protein [Rubrivivax sp.]
MDATSILKFASVNVNASAHCTLFVDARSRNDFVLPASERSPGLPIYRTIGVVPVRMCAETI